MVRPRDQNVPEKIGEASPVSCIQGKVARDEVDQGPGGSD